MAPSEAGVLKHTPEKSSTAKAAVDEDSAEQTLLAVDLGLRTGLALYGGDGRLRRYRSHNFGTPQRLRRAIPRIMGECPDLAWLVAEGDRGLFERWGREANRRGISTRLVPAEIWRGRLLYARQRRHGPGAKAAADAMARRIIAWSGAKRPTSLRHDAAEAILLGLWAVLDLGWLGELPDELQREV